MRAFIRDKLGFVHTDTGEGYLVFDIPEADLGVHPSDKVFHSISFYCDDIHKTVEDLRSRGVEFSSGITEEEWGSLTHFRMPGNMEVELYQPKYTKLPHHKASKPRATRRTGRKSRRMKR
ncbi:extradiol dioxygenase [Candidatus Bathyarchaeota archaeon]|nr:MAG: extradiol dioxygenase [Candidatus Bathyarchaeota archaeon]